MIKLFSKITLLIFLYYVTYYFYTGLINPIPALGDSWDYHIPISESILQGTFVNPVKNKLPMLYYPGASEAINSIFILLHIPLTISNLFAAVILFLVLWKLAITFGLEYYYGLLFALTFVTLNVIVRWFNAVSIDIWVAVFFSLTIILLERPKKSTGYFFSLGTVLGSLIGSKYTALFYAAVLLVIYFKKLIKIINVKNVMAFLVPFSFFGLFWYIRNYLITGNPIYPLCVLSFPCIGIFNQNVFSVTLTHPRDMLYAVFSEYKLWMLAPLAVIYFLFKFKDIYTVKSMRAFKLLSAIGIINLLIYALLPTSEQFPIMVSSLRYSYVAFIPLVLGVFIIFRHFKKEILIGYLTISGAINVLSMAYYPKLILLYLPVSAIVFRLINKSGK